MASAAQPILRIRSPIIGRGEQVFVLGTSPVTIGRADDCDIVLLEQSASRLHARLLPHADGWELVDEGSDGGVLLDGHRVARRVLGDGASFRIGETEFQLVLRPAAQPTLIGATRPPAVDGAPSPDRSAFAPTLMRDGEPEPSSLSVAPIVAPAAVVVPGPPPPKPAPPPPPAPPRPAPPVSAPSFVDFGPVGRPDAPAGSAPSFVDFGAVGRPEAPASAPSFVDFGAVGRPGAAPGQSASFTGDLSGDPSQIERIERRSGSRIGTWIVVVLLFGALITAVIALAYDVTLDDVLRGLGL